MVGATLLSHVSLAPSKDLTDMFVTACVTAEDKVTVVVSNPTATTVNLGGFTVDIVVNKAPRRGDPLYFASADTIDFAKISTDKLLEMYQ